MRDNEEGARAFTVPATRIKLQSFVVSGFIAGLGGSVYGHLLAQAAPRDFPVEAGISVVAMAVLGGLGIIVGPLLGAFYILGVPQLWPLDNAALAATAVGWLLLILYFPGGIAQLVQPLRERAIWKLGGRLGYGDGEPEEEWVSDEVGVVAGEVPGVGGANGEGEWASRGEVLLKVENVRKQYGGVRAVEGVSFEVRSGETVGLIGPNGAGKTTLFDVVTGFAACDVGRIVFKGDDVTQMSPEKRGRLGKIRSFQGCMLFPTLTVLEVVKLSLERATPTRFWASLVGVYGEERAKEGRARELIESMGLGVYADKRINELSTGTRRMVEIACLLALEPTLLLLDEPSSGIAQRETEALGELLVTVKERLKVTLVVIEHDIPLVMGLSDRMLAMDSGRIIAEGTPEAVRNDSKVVSSYLGGDRNAVERSGVSREEA